MAMALIPLSLIPWMRHKDIRWVAGLTGIYISFTLILIYLINRQRYRRRKWAAMEFLLKALKKSRRRLQV